MIYWSGNERLYRLTKLNFTPNYSKIGVNLLQFTPKLEQKNCLWYKSIKMKQLTYTILNGKIISK